jgi:hypothetical protein
MDSDPIKQLQSFLADRGKVLEKISGIHSALESLRGAAVESPPPQSIPTPPIDQVAEDVHFRRLIQALHDMQAQIEQRVRPAAQAVIDSQVERLRDEASGRMSALQDCLRQIDDSIVKCMAGVDGYQKRYSSLDVLNKSLADLGAPPEAMPTAVSIDQIAEMLSSRIAQLMPATKS